jgi:hypothetical protein
MEKGQELISRTLYAFYLALLEVAIRSADAMMMFNDGNAEKIASSYMRRLNGIPDDKWKDINRRIFEHMAKLPDIIEVNSDDDLEEVNDVEEVEREPFPEYVQEKKSKKSNADGESDEGDLEQMDSDVDDDDDDVAGGQPEDANEQIEDEGNVDHNDRTGDLTEEEF